MTEFTAWKNIPTRDFNTIKGEIVDGVGLIRMTQHDKRNMHSAENCGEMTELLYQWSSNPDVAVVVIYGTEDFFSAGMSLDEYIAQPPADRYEHMEVFHRFYKYMIDYPKPTIAAVGGAAFAGACDTICHCDIRVMGENATIGMPQPKLGIHSHFSPLWRLVGIGRAKMMFFTGDRIDAQEAYRIGLADKLVPEGQVLEEAMALAKRMAKLGSVMQRRLKEIAMRAPTMEPISAVAYETAMYREVCYPDEARASVLSGLNDVREKQSRAMAQIL